MSISKAQLRHIFKQVQTPARYIGHEEGSIQKEPAAVELNCALCYPDKYEVGMSNRGIEILYFRGNDLENVFVQRCYAPDLDMLEQLTQHDLPLFTLEAKQPLRECDLVGFSMQHELLCSNLLLMLDYAKITLLAADRREEEPLIFIGGPLAHNPEPLADFIDFALVGEGEFLFESVLQELAKPEIKALNRAAKLQHLQSLPLDGIYIPSLFFRDYRLLCYRFSPD